MYITVKMNKYEYININKRILDLEERGLESHRAPERKEMSTWDSDSREREGSLRCTVCCLFLGRCPTAKLPSDVRTILTKPRVYIPRENGTHGEGK